MKREENDKSLYASADRLNTFIVKQEIISLAYKLHIMYMYHLINRQVKQKRETK